MRKRLLALVFSTLLTTTLGCEEPKITPEQAQPFVAQWAEQIGPAIKEKASSAAASESLKTSLSAAIASESKALKRAEPSYATFAQEIYGARKFKMGFIKGTTLTPGGEEVLKLLERVDQDGFDARIYDAASVRKDLEELAGLSQEYQRLGEFSPGDAERAFVLESVLQKKPDAFALDASSNEAMNDALLANDAGDELKAQLDSFQETSKKMAHVQARIETTLAIGLMRYARNMRFNHHKDIFVHPRHDDYYNDYEIRGKRPADALGAYEAGGRWRNAIFTAQAIAKQKGDAVHTPHIKATLTTLLDTTDQKGAASALAKLSPSPQYDALRKELVRYREIEARGGWEKISAQKSVKKGSRHAVVKQLKKRMQLEGYYPADKTELTDLFDADLDDAVRAYQRTHQMDVDGKPDKSFWRSINVSAKERKEQIALNMERWRTSNVNHHEDPTYVIVNIPDFHAEIWKDQALAKRMRVVVGNNDRERNDESGKLEHPNRTPKISAYIDRVIYNPFWNITPRIRENETLVDVRKDLEKRYQDKVDRLVGTPAAPASPGIAAPEGGLGNVLGIKQAPAAKLYTKSSDGWRLNVAAFSAAYQAKTGAAPDLATLFPYVVPETGLVDVSTTKPDNIPPWYAANGYEVMFPGKSWEYVRQLNGNDNSLGRVKIIFPNLHDVYLHDTPHKGLFGREIRAFSHGCMRMHEPLDFAAWLLENDGQYDESTIKGYLADITYMPIFLKRKVPVHVEYFTVRPDKEGRANFLIDIYSYDDKS